MNLQELRYNIFSRDFFTCQKCGATGHEKLSMAHRIKSGKQSQNYIIQFIYDEYDVMINKKQADEILYNEKNLVTACRGNCNDSFNIFYKQEQRDFLIKKIWNGLKETK